MRLAPNYKTVSFFCFFAAHTISESADIIIILFEYWSRNAATDCSLQSCLNYWLIELSTFNFVSFTQNSFETQNYCHADIRARTKQNYKIKFNKVFYAVLTHFISVVVHAYEMKHSWLCNKSAQFFIKCGNMSFNLWNACFMTNAQ